MRRIWIVALALFGAAGLARAQGVNKPATLPEGVLGVVEFHDPSAVQEHLQTFVAAVSPQTPQFPAVSMALAMMAKTTNPGLMDPSAPARILLVQAGEGAISPVLQFSAKDVTDYRASLLPTLVKVEEKDGITSYTQEKRDFDHKAYQQATPEERKNFQRFMTTTKVPVIIGESDKVVCVSDSVPAVQAVLALVKKGALGNAPVLEGGDVAAQVELRALLGHMAAGKASAFAGFKESMKGMFSMMPLPAGRNPELLQHLLGVEIDAAEACAKQVERVSARLDFAAEDARLSLNIAPARGGALAAYLASVPTGVPDTLKYLPDDAFIAAACKVGNLEPLMNSFTSLLTKINTAVGMEPAASAAIEKQAVEIFRAYGDQVACGFSPGEGMHLVEAIRLKNPDAFKAAMAKMPELMAPLLRMYRNMGISVQFQSETTPYNGHEITRWKFPFDVKPPEGATPEQAAALELQQKMMKAAYGDAMTMDCAMVEKDFVLAFGKDSLHTLEMILDGRQQKVTETESLKSALAALPPQATGFALIHVTGAADWALTQARNAQATAGGMHPVIPAFKFQQGPGATVFFLKAPDGSCICNLRVPAAEIKAVVDGFKAGVASTPRGQELARREEALRNLQQINRDLEKLNRETEKKLGDFKPFVWQPPATPVPAAPAQ